MIKCQTSAGKSNKHNRCRKLTFGCLIHSVPDLELIGMFLC